MHVAFRDCGECLLELRLLCPAGRVVCKVSTSPMCRKLTRREKRKIACILFRDLACQCWLGFGSFHTSPVTILHILQHEFTVVSGAKLLCKVATK